jgi:hypothetical protein
MANFTIDKYPLRNATLILITESAEKVSYLRVFVLYEVSQEGSCHVNQDTPVYSMPWERIIHGTYYINEGWGERERDRERESGSWRNTDPNMVVHVLALEGRKLSVIMIILHIHKRECFNSLN